MDHFKEIASFVRTVDRGSFAAAAQEEGVTPVVLGRRLDALEKRLGARLLHRSTRSMTLTEDGAVFLENCRRVLHDLEQAERAISAGKHAANERGSDEPCAAGDEQVADRTRHGQPTSR